MAKSPDIEEPVDSEGKDAELEQYLKAMSMYDSEMNRSWTRLNIFIGLQVGFFALMITVGKDAAINPAVCRLALCVLLLISMSSAIVVARGLFSQKSMTEALWKLEVDSDRRFHLLHTLRSVTRTRLTINNTVAVVLSWALFLLWVFLLIYLESNDYDISRPIHHS